MGDPIRDYYFIVPDAEDVHVLLVPEGKPRTCLSNSLYRRPEQRRTIKN